MEKVIKPIESLRGEISLPGDKSISHRVVLMGAIAEGDTEGSNFLTADDCLRTVECFRDMGVDIRLEGKRILIKGKGLRGLKKPVKELYAGNSGTTMRLLSGILAGQNFEATLTGDQSLSRRPMARIIEPLRAMSVSACSKNADNLPPLVIKGGVVSPVSYSTKVASAQVKSCILLAGLYADGTTSVTEPFLSRDHTERMLPAFGVGISIKKRSVSVKGPAELRAAQFFIPGDMSSAAFFIAAACMLKGSEITLREIGLNPTRTGFMEAVKRMGADVEILKSKNTKEPYGDVRAGYSDLKAIVIEKSEIPKIIDEIPIFAVLASQAKGDTVIKGVAELKVKETDRVFSITENLRRMGADIRCEGEDLIIRGNRGRFKPSKIASFNDHRTAMSVAVAGLFAAGESVIDDVSCVDISFPEFFEVLDCLKK